MFNIGVIGAGYVGLVTAACLAELGNKVICVDNDLKKIQSLKKGIMPIFEPGLDELIAKNRKAKRLSFASAIREAAEKTDIVFICVGTPPRADGAADMAAVARVASEIASCIKGYKVIVGKSTVPAQTGERIKQTIELYSKGVKKLDFDVVSNPEFLREGQAIHDTFHPDRIVIGVESKRAEKIMRELYKPIDAPVIVTNIPTAEIIKHACNCFLSTKISFINMIARLCEKIGADVEKVAEGMGMDKRIGRAFLNAGAGFGGYCFPKDLDAFIHLGEQKGCDFELLKGVRRINQEQKDIILKKIEESLWVMKNKTIAVLGLSFKPETDDVRNSIAVDIVRQLVKMGTKVRAFDPQAMAKAKQELTGSEVSYCKSAYDAAKGSDCLLVMTEWNDFSGLDLGKLKKLMNQPVIVDGRNIFDPKKARSAGFTYSCVGRPC